MYRGQKCLVLALPQKTGATQVKVLWHYDQIWWDGQNCRRLENNLRWFIPKKWCEEKSRLIRLYIDLKLSWTITPAATFERVFLPAYKNLDDNTTAIDWGCYPPNLILITHNILQKDGSLTVAFSSSSSVLSDLNLEKGVAATVLDWLISQRMHSDVKKGAARTRKWRGENKEIET